MLFVYSIMCFLFGKYKNLCKVLNKVIINFLVYGIINFLSIFSFFYHSDVFEHHQVMRNKVLFESKYIDNLTDAELWSFV